MTPEAAAIAALSLTESLVLALAEHGVLPDRELRGALEDAEISHSQAAEHGREPDLNREAAAAIRRIFRALDCVDWHRP